MRYIFFFCLTLMAFLACEEDKVTTTVKMSYAMTQCADPWHDDEFFKANDGSKALKSFLEKKGVSVVSINIKTDEECAKMIQCAACICASCQIVTVEVSEDDVATMEGLKFKK